MPFRANAVVVFLVVFAILYILISPLPEMAAATKATQILLLLVLSFAGIGISLIGTYRAVQLRQESETGLRSSRALLGSMLC